MALVKNNNRNLVQVSGGGSVSGSNNVKPAIQTPPKNTSIEDYQKAEQIVNNPAMSGMSGVKGGGTGNSPAITQIDGASKVSAPTVTPTTPPTQNLATSKPNNASPANVKPTTTPSIVQVDGGTKLNIPSKGTDMVGVNKYTKTETEDKALEVPSKPQSSKEYHLQNDSKNQGGGTGGGSGSDTEVEDDDVIEEEVIDEKAKAREEAYQAKKDSIMQHYQDQVDKLNKDTLNAKNEAHQAQQLASKYAENGLKQMGLNNTGLTESSNQANINNYMNAISGINASKAETEASINQNYKDQLANLEDEEAQRLEQEEAELEAEEEKAKLENEKAEATAISRFENIYEHLSEEERQAKLDAMLNSNISDEAKAYLKDYANAISNTETQMKGTVNDQRYSSLDDMNTIIETGTYNGKTLTKPQLEQVSKFEEAMMKATTQEEVDKINEQMKEYLYTGKIDGVEVETKVEGPIDTNKGKVNNNGDTFENNYGDRKQGNNFSLNIGGEIKRVQTGQAVLYGSELDNKLESYSQKCGALAVVDGVLYARDQSCWYVVEPRNDSHWEDIKKEYGLTNYGKDYDLGKNGFDNSKASGNQNVRVNLEIKSGKGSKESPYYYDVQKSDIKKSIKEGKIKDGTWVSYNIGNMVYTGEVVDGKLKERRKENEFEYMN